jgi:hypothetical protein
LSIDDQLGAPELAAQSGVVALQLLDLSRRGIRLWPPLSGSKRRLIGCTELLAPARDHRGVDALAPQEAPSVPAALQRSASASKRRFSLPENRRRLAIATTSASRRIASVEESDIPFSGGFSNEVMCMSYLYSKLPE